MSTRSEYKAYMAHLWNRHRRRLGEYAEERDVRHHLLFRPLRIMGSAWPVVRAIDCGVAPEAFTHAALRRTLDDVSTGVSYTSHALADSDLLPLLDTEYTLMVSEMRASDLPSNEASMLRAYGFDITDSDLAAMVYKVRAAADSNYSRNTRLSMALVEADASLAEASKLYSDDGESDAGRKPLPKGEPPQRRPRIFKGLGKMVTGTGLILVDLAWASGAFAPEVGAPYGSLTSIALGAGTFMDGIGEVRGE